MTRIFLVRHAKAGKRIESPEDRLRSLSNKGRKQSKKLVRPLIVAGASPTLIASPFVRCMETLGPLAADLGCNVVADELLAEDASFIDTIDMLQTLPDGAVACTHGNIIPEVIEGLIRRGAVVSGEPQWAKGSVWVLERSGTGEFTAATAWPPPDIR